MAFTETQKSNIRHYLGFPDVYLDRNSRLEGAMDLIGARAEPTAIAVALLASIAAVETSLANALSQAGLKRAEDVEWYQSGTGGSAAIDQRRAEGRRFVSQLSILFGVPIVNDVFGGSGYLTDKWTSAAFQTGGIIPIG